MFDLYTRLTSKELRWLDRRAKSPYGVGVPNEVREKIIKLGYGIPDGSDSFKLTSKGIACLRRRGRSRLFDIARYHF